MGIHHADGYSATVEGFFVLGERRIRLAKTNGYSFALAESCEIQPGAEGDLLVIVDGNKSSRRVIVPQGATMGQTVVEYLVAAPF